LRLARLRLLESDRQSEAMRRSNSWWLTAPLRSAGRRWPGGARRAMQAVKLAAWAASLQLPARLRGQCAIAAVPPAIDISGDISGPPIDASLPPGRRRILIADERVPRPDRDAGSRSTLSVMAALLEAGWGVAFWPQERGYAGPYAEALAAQGVAVIDGRWRGGFADWLHAQGGALDHALLMRPRPASALLADVLRHSRAAISYYGHDVHGVRLRRAAEVRRDPFLADMAERELALERQIWRAVDVVLYPSEVETAFVRACEPGVTAATIPLLAFSSFPAAPSPPRADTLLFVGGFGHVPNTDAALWFTRDILPLVLAQRPRARLVLAGADPPAAVRALAGARVEVAGWLGEAALAARYDCTRVVVAPLRFGAGVKGKIVDALHLGRPVVTTGIGAEGLPGLAEVLPVADDPAGFAAAIVELLSDDMAWRAQAAAQIGYARAQFSPAALRAALLGALEG
jgi:glycosyltransferase involved in cell wall biosynthesis